jgi:tetratricopeptide (TPR) repeat protein
MHQPILDALRRGAHDEALAAAREAVAAHPDDAQAHRWLAVALAQAGKPQDALESIESAIALAPEDADLHLVRGSLLLAMRETDKAGAALSQATTLDPNQLGAYFLQAQLALARGDADEAERQARLAAILAPEHPQLDVIHGMAAVHRGDTKGAIQLLTTASERGEDPQLLYALGHAYLQEGHVAFAEQAFAKMLEMTPDSAGLRGMIAALRLQQRRPDEALEVLQPVLDAAEPAFAAQRMAGIIELAASRPQQALRWLRAAFSMRPTDARVISAAAQAWQGAERQEEARAALDAALAAHPRERALWQARIRFAEAREGRELLDRWLQALPDDPEALELLASAHDIAGEKEKALELTRRLTEVAPDLLGPALRLASHELREDPGAAIERLQALVPRHPAPERQILLHARLVQAHDRLGPPGQRAAEWLAERRALHDNALPLPEPVPAPARWPEAGTHQGRHATAMLWGAPGSGVELLAEAGTAGNLPLLFDRMGRNAPDDAFQSALTAQRLASGETTPEAVIDTWTRGLRQRAADNRPVIDWLPWWDNALLLALRPLLPDARLLVALRDPRDMLLNWLAFGNRPPLRLDEPVEAAGWLARTLGQVAELHEHEFQPHRLVRLDDALDNPAALTDALNLALDTQIAPPTRPLYYGPRLPAGRWRHYQEALAEPFAELHAVAQRLGYPSA